MAVDKQQLAQDFHQFSILSAGGEGGGAGGGAQGGSQELAALEAALRQAGIPTGDEGVTPQFFGNFFRSINVPGIATQIGGALGGAVGGSTGANIGSTVGGAIGSLGRSLGLFENTTDYEMQFLDGYLQGQVGTLIQKLYQYVRTHSNLVECVPLVTQCVQLAAQRQYVKALAKGYEAYRCIEAKV